MKTFNQLCKTVEELSPIDYIGVIDDKAKTIIPALHSLVGDEKHVSDMLAAFLMASVYADGKLDEAEYLLLLPYMKYLFGDDFDYDSAKEIVKAFRPEGEDLKDIVDILVDYLGILSEDLKDDIVIVCLLICAIDGKITRKEKKYINQLMQ